MSNDNPEEGDSYDWTPEMIAQQAVKRCQAEDPPSKALVILLWDEKESQYDTGFFNSGMKLSEVVALIEYVKHDILRTMQEKE